MTTDLQKTLVILSPGFAAGEEDTTCLPAQQELVRALRRQSPDLKLVIVAFQYPFAGGRYQWEGAEVVAMAGRNRSRWRRVLLWQRVWRLLKQLHRAQNIVGLVSFWYGECAWVGQSFARRHELPHYCWLLGQDARAGNRYVARAQLPAHSLIALSDFLRNEFKRNYNIHPVHLLTNGTGLCEKYPSAGARTIDVIGVGSLIPLKRYHLFVEIIWQLKKTHPGIKALICGAGPEENSLREQIAMLQLEGHIELAGEVPHVEILALLAQSKALLHPSSYEGFSTVCLEALACGAQVVSFCRAMDAPVEGWQIVKTVDEMQRKVDVILSNPDMLYMQRFPYCMDDTATGLLHLLTLQPVTEPEQLPGNRFRT